MYKFWGGEGARTGGPGTGDTYAHEILKRSTPYFILCAESGIFWRRGEIMRTIREELAPVYEGGSPKGKGGGCLHLLIQYSTDNHNTSTTSIICTIITVLDRRGRVYHPIPRVLAEVTSEPRPAEPSRRLGTGADTHGTLR